MNYLKMALDFKKTLDTIEKKRILVGIPEDPANSGTEENPTNAQKLYKNTVGSPLEHIPPRPLIEPAIQDKFEEISNELKMAVMKGFIGDTEGMEIGYNRVGLMAQQACVNWFDNPKNNWPPNAPLTIEIKGSDSPLIDTGEMRKSITYIIEDKDK